MVVVLKLGGSVLTEKAEPETVDTAALDACAAAIGADHDGLLLVHGGGSFGHYHADRYGVSVTAGTDDPRAVFAVHDSMRRLNDAVVGALHDRGVPAVGIHPLSLAYRDAAGTLSLPGQPHSTMLDRGVVPVLFGDVIAHAGHGFTVVSGDELAVELAATLGASRVGMCSSEPGVLDESGAVMPRIGSFAEVEAALGAGDGWDVTGGMAEKVRALLGLAMPSSVFGVDDLPGFLAGDDVGTRIDPEA